MYSLKLILFNYFQVQCCVGCTSLSACLSICCAPLYVLHHYGQSSLSSDWSLILFPEKLGVHKRLETEDMYSDNFRLRCFIINQVLYD